MTHRFISSVSLTLAVFAGSIVVTPWVGLAAPAAATRTPAAPHAPRTPECSAQDSFSFQVERPGGVAVKRLQLYAEVREHRAPGYVNESGSVQFCIVGAKTGDMVGIKSEPGEFRVLYPSSSGLALSHNGVQSIVVCEVRSDCSVVGTANIAALLQKAQSETRGMSRPDMEAMFHRWLEDVERMSHEIRSDNTQLIGALLHKERQIEALEHASDLLHRYGNRAAEIAARFERHAESALDYRSADDFDEMNEATHDYNPVFDEMRERADGYLRATSDAWGADITAELRALIDEALEIHYQCINPMNRTLQMINACVRKRRNCPATSRTDVQTAQRMAHDVTQPRLAQFEQKTTAWLDAVTGRLYGDPAAAGVRP